jgi:hypothetical protein
MKFKLFHKGLLVGYMELQPRHCDSCDLLWRYSENGTTGWDGQGRKKPIFNSVELVKGK